MSKICPFLEHYFNIFLNEITSHFLSCFYPIKIYLVQKLDGSVPVKYGLRLNMDEKYKSLKREVSYLSNIPPGELLIVEVNGPNVKVSVF